MKYIEKHNQVVYLKKPTESNGYHQILDFLKGNELNYAITANPVIYDSLIQQFRATIMPRTLENGERQLRVLVDGV